MPENQVFGRAGGGVDIRVAEWHKIIIGTKTEIDSVLPYSHTIVQ